jgi:hypothetical protein
MLKWLLEKVLGCGPLAGIQVLRASPGDLVVLRHPDHLRHEIVDRLREGFKDLLPPGVQVVVLEGGLSIEAVLKPDPWAHVASPKIRHHA